MFGLTFDIRTNLEDIRKGNTDLQKKRLPKAQLNAVECTGRYVYGALRSEISEVVDRRTQWTIQSVQINKATAKRPVLSIWISEDANKGIPSAVFLRPQIQGGQRRHKRFEQALIARGLMPRTMYAVPGAQAPLDSHGNVAGSFIVRMLSDLQAFGESGYRANRKGKRRGARRTNYFFVPPKGSTLKPSVYWRLPNSTLGVVFVTAAAYEKRYDFYGVGERAYQRVATRFMTEALRELIRKDNH